MGRAIAQHVRFRTLYRLSRPLQNNDMKSPKCASSANGDRDAKLFLSPFEFNATYVRCAKVEVWRRKGR